MLNSFSVRDPNSSLMSPLWKSSGCSWVSFPFHVYQWVCARVCTCTWNVCLCGYLSLGVHVCVKPEANAFCNHSLSFQESLTELRSQLFSSQASQWVPEITLSPSPVVPNFLHGLLRPDLSSSALYGKNFQQPYHVSSLGFLPSLLPLRSKDRGPRILSMLRVRSWKLLTSENKSVSKPTSKVIWVHLEM